MSVRLNLPPGCEGFTGANGFRTQESRAGGTITVSDEVARRIEGAYGGDAGLVQATNRVFTRGTRTGRWCRDCQPARLWNAWTVYCNRCGSATEPEQAQASAGTGR